MDAVENSSRKLPADPAPRFIARKGTRWLAAAAVSLALGLGVAGVAGAVDGTLELISQPTGVADPGTADVNLRAASADGSRVIFQTDQALTADDNDSARPDIYERAGGVTTLLSKPATGPDPDTGEPSFGDASADASHVFFETPEKLAADDTDTPDKPDVYERSGGVTKLVSQPTGVVDPNSSQANFGGASTDGSRVFFSTDQKLTADDTDSNLFDVYERAGGVTTLISKAAPVPGELNTDGASFAGASADGSRVFFETAQKLTADDNDTGFGDLYERSGGVTTLVSKETGVSDPTSAYASFAGASADGSRVFFTTDQALTTDDLEAGEQDVYERSGGVTALVSKPTGAAGPDTESAYFEGASDDGSRVFFSTAQKLTTGDNDTGQDDVYERSGGVTTLVSQPTGVADPDSEAAEFEGASTDGGRVFFDTDQKLTADDDDAANGDVYERASGTTTLISKPTGVVNPNAGGFFSGASADGSRVFFGTNKKMTADDNDSGRGDVYQRAGGITTLVSKTGDVADPDSDSASFDAASTDGGRVFFDTQQRLSSLDNDGVFADIYAVDLPLPAAEPGSPPAPGAGPLADATAPKLTLGGSARQRGAIVVTVQCDEACTVVASASVNAPGASKVFKLKKVNKALAAGVKTKITIKLTKKVRTAAKRALKRGKRVKATVTLKASDAAGNASSAKRKIRLVR